MVKPRKLQLFGHICRMNDQRLMKIVMLGMMEDDRPRGRPARRWSDDVTDCSAYVHYQRLFNWRLTERSNNNNNNNNHDDIYSAVIMTEVIARVHSVHLVNVEQRQAAADPQAKPPDLGCESACFRRTHIQTTIAIYYYYSARKLILICRPKAELT